MDIQTVGTDAFEMDCVRFGNGPRPFVILPGLAVQSVLASADAVAAAYKPFTEDFTVWLFDPRKDLPPGYAVRDMSRDTAAAMRFPGRPRVRGWCRRRNRVGNPRCRTAPVRRPRPRPLRHRARFRRPDAGVLPSGMNTAGECGGSFCGSVAEEGGRVDSGRGKVFGSSEMIVGGEDGRESVERYLGEWRAREHSPPSERGVPPAGRWLMDCECGAEGKGGGGSTAGGRGCRLSHGPSAEGLILLLRCKVALAATADRSTPPVAAPAACRLPCIRHPFMAAPPPSRRGECPVAPLVPCIRGIPEVVPL